MGPFGEVSLLLETIAQLQYVNITWLNLHRIFVILIELTKRTQAEADAVKNILCWSDVWNGSILSWFALLVRGFKNCMACHNLYCMRVTTFIACVSQPLLHACHNLYCMRVTTFIACASQPLLHVCQKLYFSPLSIYVRAAELCGFAAVYVI